MTKCNSCHKNEIEWAWQPFGPSDSINSFSFPGSHYRGFPVVKICDECKAEVEKGEVSVMFTHKHQCYYAYKGEVKENPL